MLKDEQISNQAQNLLAGGVTRTSNSIQAQKKPSSKLDAWIAAATQKVPSPDVGGSVGPELP